MSACVCVALAIIFHARVRSDPVVKSVASGYVKQLSSGTVQGRLFARKTAFVFVSLMFSVLSPVCSVARHVD